MNADAFLANVSAAVEKQRLPDPGQERATRADAATAVDLAAGFRANLEAVNGRFHDTADYAEATALVIDLIRGAGVEPFLSWDQEHLRIPDLIEDLGRAGLVRRNEVVPADTTGRRRHQVGYFDTAAGLTGAEAGLAESGSIIVGSGAGRSRMASLIPETHIAVLRRDRLWASLTDWIAAHPDKLGSSANWTVITGPSRTADIEMVITHGVHGPRHVHVVMVGR